METKEIETILKAGKIAQEVVAYAREIIVPGMKLLDIANKIDDKILELRGKPAFPINLSMNEIAAHATPGWSDSGEAHGLLKVDIGVHIDGYIADTAFSLDLDGDEENRKLIEAAEMGLKVGLDDFNEGVSLGDVGKVIGNEISSRGFVPIKNLTGHQIKQHDLHAGLTIPNYDSGQDVKLSEGLFAIEPFSTNGFGRVRDGKPSGIYMLNKDGNVRDNFARKVLGFIVEEYQTLPFCSRWIYKKFGSRGLLALRMIEQAGILHQYPQLVEDGGGKVAQAEHTVLLSGGKKIVTTQSD